MNPEDIDNLMNLMAGNPIYSGEIPIRPFKLGEIAEVGYMEFQNNIGILSLTLGEMIEAIDDFELQANLKAEQHMYKTFDLLVASPEISNILVDALKMVFRTSEVKLVDDVNYEDIYVSVSKKHKIDRNNFDEVASVVKMQNNPQIGTKKKEHEYNPSNEIARQIAEKIEKGKQKVKEEKEGDGDGLMIVDIISAVTAMSNSINKINVWEYTLYQLYDEFTRLNKIDNYRVAIQASMMAPDVEVEHWSDPL